MLYLQVMERNSAKDNAMEVSEFLNLKRKTKVGQLLHWFSCVKYLSISQFPGSFMDYKYPLTARNSLLAILELECCMR